MEVDGRDSFARLDTHAPQVGGVETGVGLNPHRFGIGIVVDVLGVAGTGIGLGAWGLGPRPGIGTVDDALGVAGARGGLGGGLAARVDLGA